MWLEAWDNRYAPDKRKEKIEREIEESQRDTKRYLKKLFNQFSDDSLQHIISMLTFGFLESHEPTLALIDNLKLSEDDLRALMNDEEYFLAKDDPNFDLDFSDYDTRYV